MYLSKAPIKLSELAKQWAMKETDLIVWLTTKKIKSYCWYVGFVISTGAITKSKGNYKRFFGWVTPDSADLDPFHANKTYAKLKKFAQYDPFLRPHSRPKCFYPAKIDNDDFLKAIHFKITTADLFVMSSDVERIEDEHEEIERKTIETHVIKESGREKLSISNIKKTEKNNRLTESSKKSLLKMIFALTYHLKYNPQAKKSDVPGTIVATTSRAGLNIDPTTVKKWLDEAAKLADRLKEEEKAKLRDLEERHKNAK